MKGKRRWPYRRTLTHGCGSVVAEASGTNIWPVRGQREVTPPEDRFYYVDGQGSTPSQRYRSEDDLGLLGIDCRRYDLELSRWTTKETQPGAP